MEWLSRVLVALVVMVMGQSAVAADRWLKATTPHFNVYGAIDEPELREAASDLERYHRLLAGVMRVEDKPQAARLDIYLVAQRDDLEKVEPEVDAVGFYRAGPGGRAALATWNASDREQARHVLQHEYAHHFMAQNFAWPYPLWFREGFAEYFGATVERGDKLQLGGPVATRVPSLERQSWITLDALLDARMDSPRLGMVYAQGWLLTHYLLGDPERAGQLRAYFAALRAGQPEPDAFVAAFKTDKTSLQRQLTSYAKSGMTMTVVPVAPLVAEDVTVTALSPAYGDLMLDSLRLIRGRRGETDRQASDIVKAIAAKAARYPDDPFATRTLAHAQQAFGDPTVAVELLKGTPALQTDPYAQYLLGVAWQTVGRRDPARLAETSGESRKALARALKLDPTFYPALYRYARTQPQDSDAALDALVGAHLLAPQVEQIRIDAVIALLGKGEYDSAAGLIAPLAQSPHLSLNVAVAQVLREKAIAHQGAGADQALVAEARKRLEVLTAAAKG
ncbi:hypothetical protein [Caulobacter segnis]|uniref:DUF1570 domain-containing protein n=1 Tax=Caulobacter segnis TaxID=88688 RepID=A0A2W5VH79_9CAUL|nr:hypothetical protein [Caulobacter segnis]PZR36006.1 MAG: hypothetical protein DI526_05290 [Caulobacter segnis]